MTSVHNRPKSTTWTLSPIGKNNGEEVFSADEVINAYLQGKKDQLKDLHRVLAEHLDYQVNRAMEICEELYSHLEENKIGVSTAYLSMKHSSQFDTIFVIDEDDWCSDEFDQYYAKGLEIMEVEQDEMFNISIIFMPKTNHLNSTMLKSDGYIFSYPKIR